MKLPALLFREGFGARRECEDLVAAGLVRVAGEVADDLHRDYPDDGLQVEVEGRAWTCHARALVMLHKPAGYECSRKPAAWPSVLSLLPPPLRRRGVQPIGRLDQDTTGLLLLTDDGPLIHALTSPKRHVPKVYEAVTADPVTAAQLDELLRGVVLHDDPKPVRAASAEMLADGRLSLVLTEGKYHQVKRMVAATGNQVVALHRSRFGELALPDSLMPGQWSWVDDPQVIHGAR